MTSQTRFHLERGFPACFPVGDATAHIVSGWCFHPRKRLRRLSFVAGDKRFPIRYIHDVRVDVAKQLAEEDPQGLSLTCGFWDALPLCSDLAGRPLQVSAILEWHDGTCEEWRVGSSTLLLQAAEAANNPHIGESGAPTVVICMGTYNPDPTAFERQVASIINQTFEDWACVVNDDKSSPNLYRAITDICSRDRRFHVFQNLDNLGFYRNYEVGLWRVTRLGARYVALADQDDYWYPLKLQRSLRAFDESTTLVYCDMKIVDSAHSVLSDTYWFSRRNNWRDLDVLLLANTVTGAASVFRANLLERILPFPDKLSDAFHDHWIACCALASGPVKYVDEPLYEYVQHHSNVIGHSSLEGKSWRHAGRRLLLETGPGRTGLVRGVLVRGLALYSREYRRLEVLARTLRLRVHHLSLDVSRALRLVDGSWGSVARLYFAHVRYWLRGQTTGDAEIRLATGYLIARLAEPLIPFVRRRLIRAIRSRGSAISQSIDDGRHLGS
jgi:glycosyltransferase involved in cell wall biosynthesis